MGVVDDVLRAFDRIPVWKRLQAVPQEVDELKAKLAALEELVSGKVPGDACPFCGALAFRLESVDMHGSREVWKCQSCDKQREIRLDRPGQVARRPSPRRG